MPPTSKRRKEVCGNVLKQIVFLQERKWKRRASRAPYVCQIMEGKAFSEPPGSLCFLLLQSHGQLNFK